MWVLLIPAAVIVGAWIYGASKVGTPSPDGKPNAPPVNPISNNGATPVIDGHGTGVLPTVTSPIKVGDIVLGDFANATNVQFKVMDLVSASSPFIIVSRVADPSNTPIQMPKDSVTGVIHVS